VQRESVSRGISRASGLPFDGDYNGARMAFTSGKKLGPYEIVSALGAGGMGEVYRARDTRLDRTVAIKILPADLSSNLEAKQRFEREGRAISSLNHPNICTLYDIGQQDGIDYLVMEFLEGQTLADRLVKGPLLLDQLLKCGIEICEGLEKAHKTGVVHRDLKPGNVMLTKSGAKLMDFGLAKAATAGMPASSSLTMTLSGPSAEQPLAARGTVVGTFQYMSPEHLEGKDVDARSDIFALGAVLYEMATERKVDPDRDLEEIRPLLAAARDCSCWSFPRLAAASGTEPNPDSIRSGSRTDQVWVSTGYH
jgi:serine/threonine protein kinase